VDTNPQTLTALLYGGHPLDDALRTAK